MPLADKNCKHASRTKGFVNEDNMKLFAGCHDCGRMVCLEDLQDAAALGEPKLDIEHRVFDIQLEEKDKQVDKLCKNCKQFTLLSSAAVKNLAGSEGTCTLPSRSSTKDYTREFHSCDNWEAKEAN